LISGQERKPLSDIIITVPYFIKYDVRVKIPHEPAHKWAKALGIIATL